LSRAASSGAAAYHTIPLVKGVAARGVADLAYRTPAPRIRIPDDSLFRNALIARVLTKPARHGTDEDHQRACRDAHDQLCGLSPIDRLALDEQQLRTEIPPAVCVDQHLAIDLLNHQARALSVPCVHDDRVAPLDRTEGRLSREGRANGFHTGTPRERHGGRQNGGDEPTRHDGSLPSWDNRTAEPAIVQCVIGWRSGSQPTMAGDGFGQVLAVTGIMTVLLRLLR
jgi:hypothetical protein